MRICVFGAASAEIDRHYIEAVEALGEMLAARGHSLVYGAGASGLMGAAARGFKRGGGHITGVIPEFFKTENVERIYEHCDELIYTRDMSERKRIMEDKAEAFVIAPGGVGTFEEFFEVLTLKQLGRHAKAMAVFNIDGYYDDMIKFLMQSVERKFITSYTLGLYSCFDSAEHVADYIESYKPSDISWHSFKGGAYDD